MTGRPPVSTKWVEVDKGTAEKPDVRCRLVARDFRVKGEGHRDDLFAAMPPLEAKKLLFKMAAATWKGKSEGKEPDKICTACWTEKQPVSLPRPEAEQLGLFEKPRH